VAFERIVEEDRVIFYYRSCPRKTFMVDIKTAYVAFQNVTIFLESAIDYAKTPTCNSTNSSILTLLRDPSQFRLKKFCIEFSIKKNQKQRRRRLKILRNGKYVFCFFVKSQ